MKESSTGLETRIAGPLCYLLGLITGVVFLIVETKDMDVRFHAYQSVATFGSLFVLSIALPWVPIVGWIAGLLLAPASLIVWIVLMVKAFQEERWKLPILGDWAEEQIQV